MIKYHLRYLTWHLRYVRDGEREFGLLEDLAFAVARYRLRMDPELEVDFAHLVDHPRRGSYQFLCLGSAFRYFQMLMSLVPDKVLEGTNPAEVAERLRTIQWDHRPSASPGDDEFMMARCPFDGCFYLYATQPGCGWPIRPTEVSAEVPYCFLPE